MWRYPVRNTRIRHWKPLYAYRDRIAFDLPLQPRENAQLGPLAVSVDMARKRRRCGPHSAPARSSAGIARASCSPRRAYGIIGLL